MAGPRNRVAKTRPFAFVAGWILLACLPLHAASPPVEGDESLLKVLEAAQETNKARLSKGRLRAKVHSVWKNAGGGDFTIDLSAEVIWRDDKTYWDYQMSERERDMVFASQGRMIKDKQGFYVYFPESNLAQKIFDNKSGYRDELNLRPEDSWFKVEGTSAWSDMITPDPRQSYIDKYVVYQPETDRDTVVVERHYKTGTVMTIKASLSQGANIIAYEKVSRNKQDFWRQGSYTWQPEGNGLFSLKRYDFKRSAAGDPNRPDREYSLEILDFDPEPVIAPNRFQFESLALEPGTVVEETGARKERTYKWGEPREPAAEAALNKLADKLRARGFASPDRR